MRLAVSKVERHGTGRAGLDFLFAFYAHFIIRFEKWRPFFLLAESFEDNGNR